MTPERDVSGGETSFFAPMLVIFGEAPELGSVTGSVALVRRALEPVSELPPHAALVFDLRNGPVASFCEIRECKAAAGLPLLLLSARNVPESVFSLLRADDAVTLDADGSRHLARRVRAMIELARLRIECSFARQALGHSVSGLSVVDLSLGDGQLVHVTPVFERLTGYAKDEILGKNCRFLQGEDRDQPAIDVLREAVRTRSSATTLLRNYKKGGAPFWNELTVFPFEAHGAPTRYMAGVQHDVTALVEARMQVETLSGALSQTLQFDHAVLDGVDVGIVTTDDDGTVTFANRAASQLLGVEGADELEGCSVQRLFVLPSGPRQLLGRREKVSLAHRMSNPEGTELDLELTVSHASSGESGSSSYFYIFRDMREQKLQEAERRRFERLAAMGTMVAGFAHEVRNPVAAMRSIAEDLADKHRDADLTLPHVRLMLQMVERIERLVRTSLQFGRPATPKRALQAPAVIAAAATSEVHPRIRGTGEQVTLETEPDLPEVNVDERQIVQALVILLNNAIEATGAVSRVRMRVRSARPAEHEARRKSDPPPVVLVRFEVIDDGPGIPQEILGQIFDPFFTTKASGTGLGLSIAQQIVSENGGRLEVVSSPGVTSFTIVVPAGHEAAEP